MPFERLPFLVVIRYNGFRVSNGASNKKRLKCFEPDNVVTSSGSGSSDQVHHHLSQPGAGKGATHVAAVETGQGPERENQRCHEEQESCYETDVGEGDHRSLGVGVGLPERAGRFAGRSGRRKRLLEPGLERKRRTHRAKEQEHQEQLERIQLFLFHQTPLQVVGEQTGHQALFNTLYTIKLILSTPLHIWNKLL